MPNPTLEEAVNDAVDKTPPLETKEETVETTKTEEIQTEEKKTEPTVKMIPLDKRTQEALNLADQLADPTTGPQLIEFLHQQFVKKSEETGKSEKQVAKDFVSILKNKVSPEYHFLIEAIGPALEDVVNKSVEERVTPLKDNFNKEVERRVGESIDSEISHFMKENKIKGEEDPIWVEMNKLQKEMPMGEGVNVQTYLSRLHTLATKDSLESNVVKKTVSKINKNAEDIKIMSSEALGTQVSKGSRLPSLSESIAAAFKGERFT